MRSFLARVRIRATLSLAICSALPPLLFGQPVSREVNTVSVADTSTGVLCVVDATTRRALTGAIVQHDGQTHRIAAKACVRLPVGRVQVRRIGYNGVVTWVRPNSHGDTIGLSLAFAGARPLDTIRVRDSRRTTSVGRMVSVVSVDDAQRAGVASASQLIARLPFALVRDARGEQAVQLRGARSEQVVVLLDGMVMNDPATGQASVNDLPLSTLDAATATLGASPLSGGPGALGGVISLTSARRRNAMVRAGALGQVSAEAAWATTGRGAHWDLAAAHARAENAFSFLNTAAPTPIEERRVNNDESRTTLSLGAVGDRWQLRSLVSRTDRGMVGPMNVRTNDADRARTDRVLLRAQTAIGRQALVLGSLRHFSLAYHDPARAALNASARVWSVDVEASGDRPRSPQASAARPSIVWRAGVGTDHLRTSGGLVQGRSRAFTAAQLVTRGTRMATDIGVRVDAVGDMVQPSLSAVGERRMVASWYVSARASQTFRAPTLYDLYFSSPQRMAVRPLDPERVVADLELATHTTHRSPFGVLRAQGAVSARHTRNAIIWFPGNFGWSPANVGHEQLRGVELRVQLSPAWGELAVWSTHYDSRLRTGDLVIPTPYTPRHAAGASASATVQGVAASVFARVLGPRPFSAGPRNPAFELPAVGLIDLALSHPLPRAFTPRVGDAFVAWSLDNALGTAWQSVRGFPSPGRTLAVSVSLRHSPTSP